MKDNKDLLEILNFSADDRKKCTVMNSNDDGILI